MQRRLLLLAGALFSAPPTVRAQSRTSRIGVLFNGPPGTTWDVIHTHLVADLMSLGHTWGRDFAIEPRFAEGQLARLPALAAELASQGVDVIVTLGGPASAAAARATATIPIVFAIVTDPVAIGLLASYEASGRNVTGITSLDTGQAPAQFDVLKALLPNLERVAILSDRTIPGADAAGLAPIDRANIAAAQGLGLQPQIVKLAAPTPAAPTADFEAVFAEIDAGRSQAVLVLELPFVFPLGARIATLALARRLPAMFPGGMGGVGGLVAFGTTVTDTWRRIPAMVDRILKGAPSATMPVEVITRRELVFNAKVADQIGVTIPPGLLARADLVIR
ncbi:ABC transporter substrate-binding protein [Roseomonas sp. CAU 1739]|uniref:ABC transporter substrate-binding protein n=1 Tax=Roseomonas sp. CAU 1739 TaxID=3140364 RepID=UPI00325A4B85